MNPSEKHSGFVSLIGRPNVGKSTLLNFLVGEKLAAVSPKPQTTRGVIRGILTKPQGQIIYLDTPGHHRPHDELGKWMLQEISKAVESSDLIYWLTFPAVPHDEERKILELLKSVPIPVILVVNQIDRVKKPELFAVLDAYGKLYSFKELIPVSAKTGEQTPLLIEKTFENLPASDYLFPDDQVSDQQEKFFIQEIIREKLYHFMGEEIPYATAVIVESFKDRNDKLVDIKATVVVEKESQKGMVIGKGGLKLKQIGQAARTEIETFLQKKVFLELWVKVFPDWKHNPQMLKTLGYQ